MEKGLIEVVANKKDARRLLDLMIAANSQELELSVVTMEQIDKFIAGERRYLALFEVNGENLMEVRATKDSGKLVKEMLNENGVDYLLFPALQKSNISDYLSGQRENLLQLEVVLEDKKELQIENES